MENIEARPGVRESGQILRHMLLPAAALLLGVSSLLASVHWVNGNTGVEDPQFGFTVGLVLTALGGWELRFWWRRLHGRV
jgi:hypothetical protein